MSAGVWDVHREGSNKTPPRSQPLSTSDLKLSKNHHPILSVRTSTRTEEEWEDTRDTSPKCHIPNHNAWHLTLPPPHILSPPQADSPNVLTLTFIWGPRSTESHGPNRMQLQPAGHSREHAGSPMAPDQTHHAPPEQTHLPTSPPFLVASNAWSSGTHILLIPLWLIAAG